MNYCQLRFAAASRVVAALGVLLLALVASMSPALAQGPSAS